MILENTIKIEKTYDLGVECEVLIIWEVDEDFWTDSELADLKEESTPLKSTDRKLVLEGLTQVCRSRRTTTLVESTAPPADAYLLGGDRDDGQMLRSRELALSTSPRLKVLVRIMLDKSPVTK